MPYFSDSTERHCQAITTRGTPCHKAATEYVALTAHDEALLCPEHARQAREGRVRVQATQRREVLA